jgi:hypothetical protein
MNSPDPPVAPLTSDNQPLESGAASAAELAATLPLDWPSTARIVVLALSGGIIAGVMAWFIGEKVYNTFLPPIQDRTFMGRPSKFVSFEDQVAADTKNATLAFAVLGGALGLMLGIAGGRARRSNAGAVRGAIAGPLIGSLIAALVSCAILPRYLTALGKYHEELSHDMVVPLLVHVGLWAPCGLAAGLALGIGLRAGWRHLLNAALGGVVGAALGTALYELIAAAAFPGARTTEPIAIGWEPRLLARLLVAVLAAVVAAAVINMQAKRPSRIQAEV